MKRLIPLIVVLATGAVAYYVSDMIWTRGGRAGGVIQASGLVEGDHAVIAARAPGRITEMLVGKGEAVARGQAVAHLEDPRAKDRIAEAKRTLASLESRLRSEQAELAILQTRVPLAVKAGEATVSLTRAALQQAESSVEARRQEVERLLGVEQPDDDTKRQLEDAQAAYESAVEDAGVAQAAVEQAESELALAHAGEDEIASRIEEVAALRTDQDTASAALQELQSAASSMTVVSPSEGLIADVRAAVGDDAEAGMPLYELVSSDALCIVVNLGPKELQGVSIGREARVFLENSPEQPLEAMVTSVLPSGAGTGRWNVKLAPTPVAGMPLALGARANVQIRLRDGAKWIAPAAKK